MFSERLKTICKERGLSRSQLASIIGATRAAIARWEWLHRRLRCRGLFPYQREQRMNVSAGTAYERISGNSV